MKFKGVPKRAPQREVGFAGEHPTNSAGPMSNSRFKRILVPMDFSDCSLLALGYATALADAFQSKLILLHVIEPAAYQEHCFGISTQIGETNQTLVEAGRARLTEFAQKQSDHGRQIEVLVRM